MASSMTQQPLFAGSRKLAAHNPRPCLHTYPYPPLRSSRRCAARRAVRVQADAKPFRTPNWEVAYRYLVMEKEFSSTEPQTVKSQVDRGQAVLVDVRPRARYEAGHPQGAISIPLYQKTDFSKFSFQRYFKGLALMANGVEPVEPNPNFMEELREAAGQKGYTKAVVLACETGGTLQPNASFPTGKVSRSLMAVHRALQSGEFPGVMHLDGGVRAWSQAGLPFDGQYDESFAGRTPSAVGYKQPF